jgi:hypothetical protein
MSHHTGEVVWEPAVNRSAGRAQELHAVRISSLCVRTGSQINHQVSRPINSNRHRSDHSRCRKWPLLLRILSSYLSKMSTTRRSSSYSEIEKKKKKRELGTLISGLVCKAFKGYFRGILIQFLFSGHSIVSFLCLVTTLHI